MAICVLDPTSEEAVVTSQRTARLTSLAGRTVGIARQRQAPGP